VRKEEAWVLYVVVDHSFELQKIEEEVVDDCRAESMASCYEGDYLSLEDISA